jgi:Mrp family chromosome partitioning ATPase
MAVLGILVAFAVTPSRSPSRPQPVAGQLYRATHTIQLVSPGAAGGSNLLSTAQLLLQTGTVQQRLSGTLGPQGLSGVAVSSTTDALAGTLGVSATTNDASRAAHVADTAAGELISAVNVQSVATQKSDVARLNDDIARLTTQIENVSVRIARENAGDPSQIKSIVDRALEGALSARLNSDFNQLIAASNPPETFQDQTPAIPVPLPPAHVSPLPTNSRAVKLVLGGLVGLVLAAGGLIMLNRFDTRIRTREVAEAALGFPVLAQIPAESGRAGPWLSVYDDRLSRVAEGYRTLRTAVMLAPSGEEARWNGQGPHVVLIASPTRAEGRSSVTANLAAAFAEKLPRVVAVDGDVRKPGLGTLLGTGGGRGVDHNSHPWAPMSTRVENVFLLAGDGVEARPSGGLSWMHELIRASKPDADMMLIDSPSLLLFHDAEELLPAADAVVLIVRVGRTTIDAATRTLEQLTRLGGTVLGLCLVGVPQSWAERRAANRYGTDRPPVTIATESADAYVQTSGNGSEHAPKPATMSAVVTQVAKGADPASQVAVERFSPSPRQFWSRRSPPTEHDGESQPQAQADLGGSTQIAAPATPPSAHDPGRVLTGIERSGLADWRRNDRVLWRPVVDGVLLLVPGMPEPMALSEAAGAVWEALGSPSKDEDIEAGDSSLRPLRLSAAELHQALSELVDLGVLVPR